jgi:hypothetical protein
MKNLRCARARNSHRLEKGSLEESDSASGDSKILEDSLRARLQHTFTNSDRGKIRIDLISDALPFGQLCYPHAKRNPQRS